MTQDRWLAAMPDAEEPVPAFFYESGGRATCTWAAASGSPSTLDVRRGSCQVPPGIQKEPSVETETVCVNLSAAELGAIGVLVVQCLFTSRSDLIRACSPTRCVS